MTKTIFRWVLATLIMVSGLVADQQLAAKTKGEFEIRAVDGDTGQPIAVRMHLLNARGRPIKPPRLPFWKGHFVFSGKVVLELRPGRYTFEIERGPEYPVRTGHFMIKRGATDNTQITMTRFVDMKKEGWWSGDLHIHRAPRDVPLLMRAEDLHIAPVITWWNDRTTWKEGKIPDAAPVPLGSNAFYNLMAGEDERTGGALLYFNLPGPLPLPARSQGEFPPMIRFLKMAKQHPDAHVDIEKPFWWDVPVWIATGLCDSIGLANNHMQRDGMLDNEAWGKPHDTTFYPPPLGTGLWTQDIYYPLLNCGIRIPPSAGSASGVMSNPIGYNRVYVQCGEHLDYKAWWEGLRAGRVVVTNGPMLRPKVNGEFPGHLFRADAGNSVTLSIRLNLALRDHVNYLEIVKNGEVVHEVRLDEYRKNKGRLPNVTFTSSGWMLIRAVTDNAKTYRFASTGPYYVEIGQQPRISKEAAQFFLDWVEQRIANLKIPDAIHEKEIMKYQIAARHFWQQRVQSATSD